MGSNLRRKLITDKICVVSREARGRQWREGGFNLKEELVSQKLRVRSY